MTSVGAWCDMMKQFLDELEQSFPEVNGVKLYKERFEFLRKANPRQVVEKYMTRMQPYSDKLMNKDEEFFKTFAEDETSIIHRIGLSGHFKNGEVSENTKAAIWQYLQTLYVLGTTITSIPAEALTMIEDVASKCVESGNFDEKNLMNNMGGLLNSLQSMMDKKN